MSDIVKLAQSCVGRIKYKFGANQINSDGSGVADCSSFTQWVFKQNGINIGRNTEAQMGHGKRVEKTNIIPGDLIFFKDTYDSRYKDGVSHVGIYVGNNKFVHNSSGAGGVVTSDLNSAYYTSHYLVAKRVTDSDGDTLEDVLPDNEKDSGQVKDLSMFGDVLVVVLATLLGVAAVVFFLLAFGFQPKKLIGGINHGPAEA